MGAVVTTKQIAQTMANVYHFNTFGGNPLALAVAKAVYEVEIFKIKKIFFFIRLFKK